MAELKKRFTSQIDLLISLFPEKTIVIVLLGLILIGFGVLLFKIGVFDSKDKIEILETATNDQNISSEIVVEITGSVEKPGVYKMTSGARIEDLLIVSGGLSAVADREWVSKNINRASRLSDGQKIYIYSQSEVLSAKESDSIKVDQEVLGSNNAKLININTASNKELESLIGIGPVLAQKIVEGRIYSSLDELVKKGILSQKTFNKIVNDITY